MLARQRFEPQFLEPLDQPVLETIRVGRAVVARTALLVRPMTRHQAMKSAATQMFDMSLGREPRGDVPYDAERFELRTELVPRGEHVNGYGAAAPEGAA